MDVRSLGGSGREDLFLRTSWGNVRIILPVILLIAASSALFPYFSLATVMILAVVTFSFIFSMETFLLFIFLLLSLGEYSGGTALVMYGLNLYGADFFLILLIILIMKSQKRSLRSEFSLLLVFYVFYGLLCLFHGLFYHAYETHRAIGEFRRFFFYPLSFFVGYLIIQDKKDSKSIEKMLSFIPPIILFFAATRLISKTSWASAIHVTRGDFRAMSYYDGISLLLVFSYLISIFIIKKRLNLYHWILVLFIPIFLVLSGFRLLWALLFLSLVILLWIFLRAKKRYLRYMISIAVIMSIAFLGLKHFGGEYYEIMKGKLTKYDKRSEVWRRDAWSSALKKFYASPIVGSGLGEEPEFWTKNSVGQWVQRKNPSHNIIVDLLSQTGMIGAILFLIIISKYGLSIYRTLMRVGDEDKAMLAALFVYFVCAFIQSLFQPYLNQPGNAVSFFVCMGIGVKIISLNKVHSQDL